MMKKLIIVLFFAICTQLVWSINNQEQLLAPDNIELALSDLTDTTHYELVKEYAQSLPTSDYDQFIALLRTRQISACSKSVEFNTASILLIMLPSSAATILFSFKVGFSMAFLALGIMTYIDLRYAVTQQCHIISNLLNELKELHKAYDHQTF